MGITDLPIQSYRLNVANVLPGFWMQDGQKAIQIQCLLLWSILLIQTYRKQRVWIASGHPNAASQGDAPETL